MVQSREIICKIYYIKNSSEPTANSRPRYVKPSSERTKKPAWPKPNKRTLPFNEVEVVGDSLVWHLATHGHVDSSQQFCRPGAKLQAILYSRQSPRHETRCYVLMAGTNNLAAGGNTEHFKPSGGTNHHRNKQHTKNHLYHTASLWFCHQLHCKRSIILLTQYTRYKNWCFVSTFQFWITTN